MGIVRITVFLNKWIIFLRGINQSGFELETVSVHYEEQSKFLCTLQRGFTVQKCQWNTVKPRQSVPYVALLYSYPYSYSIRESPKTGISYCIKIVKLSVLCHPR